MKPRFTARPAASRGFTLVEMLTVMAVVAVLTVLSLPAISGLNTAGNVNNAVNGISLLLDQSRAYAMAHNTYVWVGFAQSSTPQLLTVGVVAGVTGQSTDINSASTYSPIARVQNYNNFSLSSSISGLSGMNTTAVSDISNSQVVTFRQAGGGTTLTFTKVMQFDAQGEASIATTSQPQWVQIGLQPVQGGSTSNPNVAAFQVSTLTGQVQVFRK